MGPSGHRRTPSRLASLSYRAIRQAWLIETHIQICILMSASSPSACSSHFGTSRVPRHFGGRSQSTEEFGGGSRISLHLKVLFGAFSKYKTDRRPWLETTVCSWKICCRSPILWRWCEVGFRLYELARETFYIQWAFLDFLFRGSSGLASFRTSLRVSLLAAALAGLPVKVLIWGAASLKVLSQKMHKIGAYNP